MFVNKGTSTLRLRGNLEMNVEIGVNDVLVLLFNDDDSLNAFIVNLVVRLVVSLRLAVMPSWCKFFLWVMLE